MALLKIEDFDPNYRDSFNGSDLKGMSVYTQSDEKIGTVHDVLVDEEGQFRYLVVDLGFWIFGKKVLMPVGRSQIDQSADRVYAIGMTREQAENLPEFSDRLALDYDYEESVRGVYRSPSTNMSTSSVSDNIPGVSDTIPVDASAPLEASAPLDTAAMAGGMATPTYTPTTYDRDTYNYQQDASLYDMNDRDHQTLKLYQERLIANKKRVKAGEVAIGKHVETETAKVAVPVEKERVVIERITPADAGRAVNPGEATFREGEVAHVELYEETADIHKEAFVREEVRVSKEVERDTVEAQETLRREELDINTGGIPVDERRDRI
ncbi:DUF2382 domain-containing protein [Aliterella atlantica]|uniref:Photosystem reaction center subunit H n=1 Tax=Aliterella atlantica CENA595 TaxID=1618023 RepID=A0A0D8ZS89_9CYAN|nr:DUF2382 domain-containing protein [Aliterella atlantica]KJH71359.1 photosystem reaction center subunit H [Aliterella atlantica CENA595]